MFEALENLGNAESSKTGNKWESISTINLILNKNEVSLCFIYKKIYIFLTKRIMNLLLFIAFNTKYSTFSCGLMDLIGLFGYLLLVPITTLLYHGHGHTPLIISSGILSVGKNVLWDVTPLQSLTIFRARERLVGYWVQAHHEILLVSLIVVWALPKHDYVVQCKY